ncbi:flagellar hook-basal body protein [Ideonella sp. YS5]|uniref:flagellar hook-basal body protein n=1 Tax=Ideonella sp. YS5 TaxID=3453714 RepID=UPI003EEC8032
MTSISAITLNALGNDQARIERVATNLANVQTPGYKRELWVERAGAPSAFAQAMAAMQQGAEGVDARGVPLADITPLPQAALGRDMHPATLRPTGRTLDLALAGSGLFEVATEHGPAYTRRGEFQVDARGRLVTPQGHALLGQGGEINVTSEHVGIDAAGRVLDNDKPIAQLRVVDAKAEQLRALGGGLYAADGAVQELPAAQVAVRQGFLENANVDSAHEMVSLTTSVRHFEAMLRVVQGRDEMLGTAIRKLGEV